MKIIFAVAKLKDLDELMRLAEDFEKEHFIISTRENAKMKILMKRKKNWPEIMKKYFKKCVKSRNSRVYIAKDGNVIVGYTLLNIKKNMPLSAEKSFGYFDDLFVRKNYRGLGVSTNFKNFGLKWFRQHGIKEVHIGAHWGNARARRIYEGWGFMNRDVSMVKRI
ncbi:MAG: GNAT family N-acetyltransferase [Candidatus Aenigmatarchaeota archaeon]